MNRVADLELFSLNSILNSITAHQSNADLLCWSSGEALRQSFDTLRDKIQQRISTIEELAKWEAYDPS